MICTFHLPIYLLSHTLIAEVKMNVEYMFVMNLLTSLRIIFLSTTNVKQANAEHSHKIDI